MAAHYHSKICAIAHGAMQELFAAGLLDPQSMEHFDRLCRSDRADDDPPIDWPSPPKPAAPPLAPPLPLTTRQPRAATGPSAPLEPQRRSAAALRALRLREGMSEAVFARCLNVLPQTVIAWEAGMLQPSPATAHALDLIEARGLRAVG